MTTPRQRRFLFAQVGLMLAAIGLLASIDALTLEFTFVVTFVSLVVVTALTAPLYATPRWRERLRWPLLVGGVIFAVLVGIRTFEKLVGQL